MNTSIEKQIELVNQLISSLSYYSELFEGLTERYQKYITVLENNGLIGESLKNLQEKYSENTRAMLNRLAQQIHNNDIQDAKKVIKQLEELKNSANY